jgi:hypothetical protein
VTNWFLNRLDPALAGDLLEERQRRSALWFWRQMWHGMLAAAGSNARRRSRDVCATVAGWALQFCAAVTILKLHLAPSSHGLLWRLGACAAVLLAAGVYGLVLGLLRGFYKYAATQAWRTTLSIAANAFFVNLLVCLSFVLLAEFSFTGLLLAEVYWLSSDLIRVLLARDPRSMC